MKVYENVKLKDVSYWKVGGVAKYLIDVNSPDEIKSALKFLKNKGLPSIVVGNMTNILFSDDGFEGGLIALGKDFSFIRFSDEFVTIGASTFTPHLVRKCINQKLEGIEHLVGVPASVGGAIYMNAGSQRKSISKNVIEVKSVTQEGALITRTNEECKFDYRNSIFQSNNEIILSVSLELKASEQSCSSLRRDCLNILKDRAAKFPRNLPSCGSVFVSNPTMYERFGPPGKVIEDAGLKGYKKGGASISDKHANFIVNNGGAKAKDILYLIALAISEVKNNIGETLISEVLYVSSQGDIKPAHVVAKLNNPTA